MQLVGDDYRQLANEVDKLVTWAAGEPIGEREVELLVAAVADTPTFALTDAWGQRDAAGTLNASETIFERDPKSPREVAPRLAAALGNHVVRVRQCQRLAAEGVRPRDAAGTLKMHPYYAEKLFAQAANFSEDELRDAVVRLAALDLALKGNSGSRRSRASASARRPVRRDEARERSGGRRCAAARDFLRAAVFACSACVRRPCRRAHERRCSVATCRRRPRSR